MKFSQTALSSVPPPFVPQQVVITLETQEEAQAFYHLLSCWCDQGLCICKSETVELARKLLILFKFPVGP